ncbi:MAG: AURKAIP1/COX24 domain-containing protein [Planctomycetota bacterium]|nr:AURKAIP1/COX24 domain-containing protein [Planctomycetota bacterium]
MGSVIKWRRKKIKKHKQRKLRRRMKHKRKK